MIQKIKELFKNLEEMNKARIKLTLLYFIIITVIVTTFSIIIIILQFNQLDRFNQLRENSIYQQIQTNPLINNFPDIQRLLSERNSIATAVKETKIEVLSTTVVIDIGIIFFSLLLSFYISGETLKPIEDNVEKQKAFVSDASHELRTPLASLKVEAEVLLRSKKNTNDEYKEFCNSVIEEVDKLTDLTTDLLTLAKYDNKITTLNLEEVNLVDIINNLLIKIRKLSDLNKINITFIYESNNKDLFIVNSEKIKLERLLLIILDNAVKYNKENGTIEIKLFKIKEKINIEIKDLGFGIAKEHLNKIFDRFYRVTQDRNQKGFGLGLSIASKICNELNIDLNIESNENEFTKVCIVFPKLT